MGFFPFRPDIQSFVKKEMQIYHSSNEVMVKDRIDPKHIVGVVVKDESKKIELIKILKKREVLQYENGIAYINGILADDFIHVGFKVTSSMLKRASIGSKEVIPQNPIIIPANLIMPSSESLRSRFPDSTYESDFGERRIQRFNEVEEGRDVFSNTNLSYLNSMSYFEYQPSTYLWVLYKNPEEKEEKNREFWEHYKL
jgi:hypothetical protein